MQPRFHFVPPPSRCSRVEVHPGPLFLRTQCRPLSVTRGVAPGLLCVTRSSRSSVAGITCARLREVVSMGMTALGRGNFQA
ncbi:hypothetical protein GN956_G3997 [Arapaima gigas]